METSHYHDENNVFIETLQLQHFNDIMKLLILQNVIWRAM